MNMMLKQARKGFMKLILEDPQVFTYSVSADPSNPWASSTSKTFTGRISHERAVIPSDSPTTAGISTSLAKFLSYPYTEGALQQDDIITDSESRKWRLGKPDPLRKFGGIFGYQCALTEVG